MTRLIPIALALTALAACGSTTPGNRPVSQLATGSPRVASTATPTPDICVIKTLGTFDANDAPIVTVFHKSCAQMRALDPKRMGDRVNVVLSTSPHGTPLCSGTYLGITMDVYGASADAPGAPGGGGHDADTACALLKGLSQ